MIFDVMIIALLNVNGMDFLSPELRTLLLQHSLQQPNPVG